MQIGTIQQSEHTKYSTTNSSVMVASVVDGEWIWQPYQKLVEFSFPLYVC